MNLHKSQQQNNFETKHLPLQDERRVGLTVARVVDMNCVSAVRGELAKSSLAAAHALCQTSTSTCYT